VTVKARYSTSNELVGRFEGLALDRSPLHVRYTRQDHFIGHVECPLEALLIDTMRKAIAMSTSCRHPDSRETLATIGNERAQRVTPLSAAPAPATSASADVLGLNSERVPLSIARMAMPVCRAVTMSPQVCAVPGDSRSSSQRGYNKNPKRTMHQYMAKEHGLSLLST
jgi:hypothetical protein